MQRSLTNRRTLLRTIFSSSWRSGSQAINCSTSIVSMHDLACAEAPLRELSQSIYRIRGRASGLFDRTRRDPVELLQQLAMIGGERAAAGAHRRRQRSGKVESGALCYRGRI